MTRTNNNLPTSEARRNHLKTLLIGGGVTAASFPERWVAPVINSTFLPGHASTSVIELECGPENEFRIPGTYSIRVPEGVDGLSVVVGGAKGGFGGNGGTGWGVIELEAAGAPGEVGFINPMTEPFCGHCDRLRLTAPGPIPFARSISAKASKGLELITPPKSQNTALTSGISSLHSLIVSHGCPPWSVLGLISL